MLGGYQIGDSSDEDEDLDKKAAELEAKLAKLKLDNEKLARQKAKDVRSRDRLERQVEVTKSALLFSNLIMPVDSSAKSKRYEDMRRRRDRKLGIVASPTRSKEEGDATNQSGKSHKTHL